MHHLFPYREGWWREVRIGKAAHCDPINIRVLVAFPKDVAACPFGQPVPRSDAAAIRAEMEANLEAAIRGGGELSQLVSRLVTNQARRAGGTGRGI